AMLPFCGYNMGDYFRHWINMGRLMSQPPRIYSINAFRRNEKGEFLWPGFGENIRILKWIIERVNGRAGAKETPLGLVPEKKDLDLTGLNLPEENLEELFRINPEEWGEELDDIKSFLKKFGRHMPYEIWQEYDRLKQGLGY
ncbi:MAG: phosphoenolpyruvate carboxykinase domain-containing protein, partial [Candidatus Saccharicenans sp.]|nr:phosphoenolpyruvate carboxykinase domain-containing protein [Candidatus Saccharicenans sp.]